MLFNSWLFVLFFLIVYLLYLRLSHRGQNWLLLVASYVFYGAWDYRFTSLLAISTVIDYCAGLALARSTRPAARRWVLVLSLCSNLGILAFFKYCDFFLESFLALLGAFGYHAPAESLGIVLPVGISFYTFQSMSYAIDVYRGRLAPCRSLRDYALFVAFFPQLVAGPIERATNLLRQVTAPRVLSLRQIRYGLWLLVQGYFLKIVLADNAARIANAAFAAPAPHGGTALLGVYAFAFQIYGDFAGYSSIARGLAKLMGFELMVNFRRPYLAVSASDFWQRWHISLSSWLRDYLYIPLGGNRKGRRRTYFNLMTTMLLGGLWHGAHWRFVIWGFYHGVLLVCMRVLGIEDRARRKLDSWLHPLRVLLFFQLTCFGWLIFRCRSLAQILTFPRAIFTDFAWTSENRDTLCALLFLALPVLMMDLAEEYAGPLLARRIPSGQVLRVAAGTVRVVASFALLALLFLCGARGGSPFIYFQF